MNSYDQDRIETVLRSLGEAEPAAGIEQRITAALQRAEQGREVRAGRWVPGMLRFPHAGMALAAAMVLAAGAFLLYPRHHADRTSAPGVYVAPQPVVKRDVRADVMATARVPKVSTSPQVHQGAQAQVGRGGPQEGGEERSFPAPPLPLTEQERLLIRLIHREAPVQLAQLTAPVINAARQREADEVTAFFAPPVVVAAPDPPSSEGSTDPSQMPTNEAPQEIQ